MNTTPMGRRRRAALNDRVVSGRRRSIQIPEAPSNPYKLKTADGHAAEGEVFNTINTLK